MNVVFRRKNSQTKLLQVEEEFDYYSVPESTFLDPKDVDLFSANTNQVVLTFKRTVFDYPHFNMKPWIEYLEV